MRKLIIGLIIVVIGISCTTAPNVQARYYDHPPFQPGFTHSPIAGCSTGDDQNKNGIALPGGQVNHSSPAIAAVDGDGKKTIYIGTSSRVQDRYGPISFTAQGHVIAVRPDGSIRWQVNLGVSINSTPAIGDLYNNNKYYVVIGLAAEPDLNSPVESGGVVALDAQTGALLWRFNTRDEGPRESASNPVPGGVISSPTLVDVDGDGTLEVAFGGWDQTIYLLNSNGTVRWAHPNLDTIWSSPAAADLDGDGLPEIVIGSDFSGAFDPSRPYGVGNGGFLYAFHGDGRIKFKIFEDQAIYSSPVIADFTGDGQPDIAIGSGNYFPNQGNWTSLYDRNGTLIWRKTVSGNPTLPGGAQRPRTSGSPAPIDIDLNGVLDVVQQTEDGMLYAWRGTDGFQFWAVPIRSNNGSSNGVTVASPIIGDYNNDGNQDIFVIAFADVVVIDRTGTHLTDINGEAQPNIPNLYANYSLYNSPAISDLENDGTYEVLAAGSHICDADHGYLYAWRLSTTSNKRAIWPQFRGQATHIGKPTTETRWQTADRTVQIDPLSAAYVLKGNGRILTGGRAAAVPSSINVNYDLARSLSISDNRLGSYVMVRDRIVTSAGPAVPNMPQTIGQVNQIRSAPQDTTYRAKEFIRQKGGGSWVLDGTGRLERVLAWPDIQPRPGQANADFARSFTLSLDGRGAYVLAADGQILLGGTAPGLQATWPRTTIAAETYRRIKRLRDANVLFVLDRDGKVWSTDQSWNVAPPAGYPFNGAAVDFEMTANGLGYYLLLENGSILTAGNARPLSNPIAPFAVNRGTGEVARDLVMLDTRVLSPAISFTDYIFMPLTIQ